MLTVLAEATQNTTGLPTVAWGALIAGISTLLGIAISGFFDLAKNRRLQNDKFDEWSWNNAYELLGDIDFLHRKITHYQMPIDTPGSTIMPLDRDSQSDYTELVNQLRNKVSRFSILISNDETLQLLRVFQNDFETAHGHGLTYLSFRNADDDIVPHLLIAVGKSKTSRETLVEHVQSDLLSAIKKPYSKRWGRKGKGGHVTPVTSHDASTPNSQQPSMKNQQNKET